jgi:hypothetical protein
MLQAGRSQDRILMRWIFFKSTYSWLHYDPGVDSASNRNEYQEFKKETWGVKGSRCVGLTTLPPSVSHMSKKCGSLALLQPYGPSWPATGIFLPLPLPHLTDLVNIHS